MAQSNCTVGKRDEAELIPPKNRKMVGMLPENDRVYIEDYVVTYLTQISQERDFNSPTALFGRYEETDGLRKYYIYGAIRATGNEWSVGMQIDSGLTESILDKKKEYFNRMFFIGWALVEEYTKDVIGGDAVDTCGIQRDWLSSSFGRPRLLLRIKERELAFYRYITNQPERLGGYYIFYAQNDAMQNYLIAWHDKKYGAFEEHYSDDTTVSCRTTLLERKQGRTRSIAENATLGICILTMIVICCVGITTLNQYNKIKDVEETLEEINGSVVNIDSGETKDETALTETEQSESGSTETAQPEPMPSEIAGSETMEPVTETAKESEPVTEPSEESEPKIEDVEPIKESVTAMPEIAWEETADPEHIDVSTGGTFNSTNREYEVQKGDTLNGISKAFYGDITHVDEICRKNGIADKNAIFYGQKILLP